MCVRLCPRSANIYLKARAAQSGAALEGADREGEENYELSLGRGGLKGWDGQMECLQDRRRAAVSGIVSRGGRCLFINT